MTHTVRVYGSDEASESGIALLEEHDFTSEAAARECARELTRSGAGLVTFNGPELGRFAVLAAERGWLWTYSGITASEAKGIADTLTEGSGERWTVEPVG